MEDIQGWIDNFNRNPPIMWVMDPETNQGSGWMSKPVTTYLIKLSNNEMLKVCELHNIEVDKSSNTGQILDSIMSILVEPKLINPTFVIDYPKFYDWEAEVSKIKIMKDGKSVVLARNGVIDSGK